MDKATEILFETVIKKIDEIAVYNIDIGMVGDRLPVRKRYAPGL